MVFSRGNMVGDDHPLPAVADASVSVMCSFPSSITLIANEPGMENSPPITIYFCKYKCNSMVLL